MSTVLGASLSCAQKEAKEAPAPTLVSAVEHADLKSENQVIKSALAFQKETGEKLETQVSKLTSQVDEFLGENQQLRMLLEKMNGLLDKMQPSAHVQQIHRLLCCPN